MFHMYHTPFTRRPGPYGTTVSFCNKCFQTVFTSHREAELDTAEQDHVCDPSLLDYWNATAASIQSKNSLYGSSHTSGL